MSEKIGLNGDLGATYQFLMKLDAQLTGLWESETMLSGSEVEHLQEGLTKVSELRRIIWNKVNKFKEITDLKKSLDEKP
mgnify:CR=1 FL=1